MGIADTLPIPKTADQFRGPVQFGHAQRWLTDMNIPNSNKLSPRHTLVFGNERLPTPSANLKQTNIHPSNLPHQNCGDLCLVLAVFKMVEKGLSMICPLTLKTVSRD